MLCKIEKPQELIEKFKIKVLKEGNNRTYPKKISLLEANTKFYSMPSYHVYDDTFARNRPITLKRGRLNQVMPCWEEIISYMSLGERLFFICPYEMAYRGEGAYPWVPAKTDAPFELELIKIEDDPDFDYRTESWKIDL